ncbi:ABC transporter ATP-binding protein [Streptosporangiaceae bacterium NEAU-GS5]|nr:ABC transporter ATP-binding protein [Streptosporangiaceae bacterium NEAU-GS5]
MTGETRNDASRHNAPRDHSAAAGLSRAGRARPVWLVAVRLARFDLPRFLIGAFLWLPVMVIPLAGGLLLQRLFDQLSGARPAGLGQILWICAAFVGAEAVRGVILVIAHTYGTYWWDAAATLLRANALRSILTARGAAAARLPHSSAEAVARLRDDVAGVVSFVDEVVPLTGAVLFSGAAVAVMASIDPVITLVLVLPMVVIGVLSRLMSELVRRLHLRARVLGAQVTAYVGDIFTGVLAIKTAGAEAAALRRLRAHNRARRDAAVKDSLATDLLDTATDATVEISVGLVLLLAAAAMRRGEFTVGDLALFTSYVGWLAQLPRTVGGILFRLPQAAVSTDRLTRLMAPHESADELSRDTGVWFYRDRPPAPTPGRAEPLELLQADGLTVRLGPAGHGVHRGIHDIGLRLPRGSFTVVTGAVGSGKTTLARALLGLAPLDAGTIRWNGETVADPGTFMVPGRVAYASQIPRLFSATLRENLLLGRTGDDLARALRLAAFDDDLARLPRGLDSLVGPRGMRLSGEQIQRVTAARALARTPELLVVDDLSSALDVETERTLWDRLDGAGTLLVISHRPAVLERADQVIVLDRGRLAGRGTLRELLGDCPEMRRLYHGDVLTDLL